MKTNLRIILVLLLSTNLFIANAQNNFYPATITYEKGNTEQVFFKTKSKIVEENQVIIYKTDNYNSAVSIGANNFERIESSDGQLVFITKKVNGSENDSKLILKQIIKGDASLFVTQIKNTPRYIIQKDNEFFLMKSLTSQSGFLYKKWLYNNLNSRSLSPNDYVSLRHNKSDLVDYVLKENTTVEVLNGEQLVPFFRFGLLGGVGFYNYSFSGGSPTFSLDDASAINYQIGVRTQFHFDRIQDRFSAFLDVKYTSGSNDQADGVAFPLSNVQRRPFNHEFSFSLVQVEVGFQYNFHINSSTISPYFKFGPASYLKSSFSNFESTSPTTNPSRESDFPDTAFGFGAGLIYTYNDKISLSLGYDAMDRSRIFYVGDIVDVTWNGVSVMLIYNFL